MPPARAVVLGLLLLLAGRGAKAAERVQAGPLALGARISRAAHLFHVVDQLSEWSRFCHRQYGRGMGPPSEEDREQLAAHAAVRARHSWGAGLERAFCTPLEPDDALERAVAEGRVVVSLEPAIMGGPPPPSPDG